MQYYYDKYLKPNDPELFGKLFSDLRYEVGNGKKTSSKSLSPRKFFAEQQEPYLEGKIRIAMDTQLLEIEGEIDKINSRLYSLKSQVKLLIAAGDQQGINDLKEKIAAERHRLKVLNNLSDSSSDDSQKSPRANAYNDDTVSEPSTSSSPS